MGLIDGYTLEEVDLAQMSDLDLKPIVDFFNAVEAELRPRHIDMSITAFRVMATAPGEIRTQFVVRDPEDNVAAFLGTEYPEDGTAADLLRVHLSVAKRHRRQRIGSHLVGLAAEIARDLDRRVLTGAYVDTSEAGPAFARILRAEKTIDFHWNVIKMSDLDLDLLRSWRAEGPGRAPGYSIRLIEGVFPDDMLEGLAHLYHILERDMPHPESWEPREYTAEFVKEMSEHYAKESDALTVVAIHDGTGAAVGMSQLVRRFSNPDSWLVTTTMVDPEHRGFALGKWVKAAVNLEAIERWPPAEWQETANAFGNEAMLGINRAMGFEHELTSTSVEVGVDRVEEYLSSLNEG